MKRFVLRKPGKTELLSTVPSIISLTLPQNKSCERRMTALALRSLILIQLLTLATLRVTFLTAVLAPSPRKLGSSVNFATRFYSIIKKNWFIIVRIFFSLT